MFNNLNLIIMNANQNSKKLRFNKETIVKLNEKQKQMMKGGAKLFGDTNATGVCPTHAYTCGG